MTTTHPQGTRGGAGQGFPAGEPAAAREPGAQRAGGQAGKAPAPAERPQRPLALTGAIAACAAAGAGLATLTVVSAVAWIAAVHIGLGAGLPGVLRTAIQLWLVGHHVGFDLHSAGKIGLLPLGLVLVPGALLWRAGRWVVRSGQVQRLRHVGYAALALALPYGLLTGALAVASRTAASAPSPMQAAGAGFLLAFAAGGLGGARALAPWARLIGLLPDRARCLVVGVTGSLAVLAGAGALLTGASLLAHAHDFSLASDALSPGLLGSALLLLAALGYLPNAIIWAMAYMLGPGFAFGVGTMVAPTGTLLGPLPVFPMLTALPTGSLGPHPAPPAWAGLAVLAVPYLAGVFGGLLTVRTAPTPTVEAAPLWGFASGVLTGGVAGALAVFSGGSLGTGRLAATGPVAWQVGLVAALEVGIAAAISAGLANWLVLRRVSRAAAAATGPGTLDTDETADDAPGDVAGDPAHDMAGDAASGEGGGMPGDDVADDAVVVEDIEVARVTLLSPVTSEDLASLAESPGTDTPTLPALPAGDADEPWYLLEAPDGVADEFGYLPEPPEIADEDDAEPTGPPEPRNAPGGVQSAPAGEAEHAAQPDMPVALAFLAQLGAPVQPTSDAEPSDGAQPADDAGPADDAEPMDDAEPAVDAEPAGRAEPVDDAEPATDVQPVDDVESVDGAEPGDDAEAVEGVELVDGAERADDVKPADGLGRVIYLRPRGAGGDDGPGPAGAPDDGHDPDDDAAADPG